MVSPQLFPRQETLTSETFKLPRVHAPLRVTCLRGKKWFPVKITRFTSVHQSPLVADDVIDPPESTGFNDRSSPTDNWHSGESWWSADSTIPAGSDRNVRLVPSAAKRWRQCGRSDTVSNMSSGTRNPIFSFQFKTWHSTWPQSAPEGPLSANLRTRRKKLQVNITGAQVFSDNTKMSSL